MVEIDFEKIGLKVGLEIHQQLDTHKKLFCKCRSIENDEYTEKFSRRLRTAKSELGKSDIASEFEYYKEKKFNYYANSQSSCLVEKDEEPPHGLDHDAKKISLLISSMLGSNIFTEIHVMRKTVIDGSNTTGFQRTMLVSQGGNLKVNGKKIGVQAVCLEEDAAKLLKDEENERHYGLDRLGVPLVEIALEPVSAKPSGVKEIALSLGRLLRATRMVKRGIGSIRQDVNISVKDSGLKKYYKLESAVVEVKGVQQLDQLEKMIEYEAKRQYGLVLIAEKLRKIARDNDFDWKNVFEAHMNQFGPQYLDPDIFKDCKAKIIQDAIKEGKQILVMPVPKFSGMFNFQPYPDEPDIRLGKEIAQQVKFYGFRGILHSDEIPNSEISAEYVDKIKRTLRLDRPGRAKDGFIILVGHHPKKSLLAGKSLLEQYVPLDFALISIWHRLGEAHAGVPAETRAATPNGKTTYLRPRPGAARMYPETDVPLISVRPEEIKLARDTADATKSWDESIVEIQKKYNLNSQLSEQIFDSEYMEMFKKICENKKNSPNFVASILCSSITNLERKGLDAMLLKPEHIIESFELLASGKIPKESLEIIFENIMSGKSENVAIAMQSTDVSSMNEDELNGILDEIIQNNTELVKKLGENAVTTLMGIAMKQVRGKVSGQTVNVLLRKKISEL